MAAIAAIGFGQNEVNVVLNGQPVRFDYARPVQINGHILIPVRGVLEQLGAVVDWDQGTQTVHATRQNLSVDLRLGASVARVNGQSVNLDVPAQYLGGSTMVPLRFMSEALGASVVWVNATRTVNIDTPQVQTNSPGPNPPSQANDSGPVAISSFSADKEGFLRAGTHVRFTLLGSPNGQATLDIPGVAQDIPMRENGQGNYIADWTVPRSSKGVALTDLTAIAHLNVNGVERVAESGQAFAVDSVPPRIYGFRPSSDGAVGTFRPYISAQLSDGQGSGVDTQQVRMMLDGREVTNGLQLSNAQVSYVPEQDLDPGTHQVTITARDMAGNESTQQWSFEVARVPRRMRRLAFIQPDTYAPGSSVTFNLDADPNSDVSLSLGDRRTEVPMRETSPGHYTATYQLREGDNFGNRIVRAHVRGRDFNSDYWVEANQSFAGNRFPVSQPLFEQYQENDTVQSPFILRGRSAPNADIEIHVASSYSLLNQRQLRLKSAVGDYSVQADQNGRWQTPEIDLGRTWGSDVQYTITAYTLDPSGRKSAVTTLHLRK